MRMRIRTYKFIALLLLCAQVMYGEESYNLDVRITITSPDSVCPNDPYTFTAEIPDELYQENSLQYQWMYKSPEYPSEWRNVSGGNVRNLQIQSFKAHHVGWYKLIVAYAGHLDDPDNYFESDELFVTFKKCEPDLCIDGNLLYRDDFGGNDPSDPRVSTTPVPGMSYQQLTSDRFGVMGGGKYLVTKMGYCNGDTAALRREKGYVPNWGSQWILQDDHTYPGDFSRGYFVEIDGAGGNSAFYSTTIHDLCPGAQLTFSAYVINVHFYEQIQKYYRVGGYNYVYPRMKFVLKDPKTGTTLAEQSTGDIQPDVTKSWNIHLLESAEWQLVGMKFTVPPGVESIQMYIYNDAQGGTGNDFAIDDIEVRLCAPPVTIIAPDSVCIDTKNILHADSENDGTFVEPLQYQWYFSADSSTWTPLSYGNAKDLKLKAKPQHSGWYRVAVAGSGNIEAANCRAMSEPHKLYVIPDCPPILCADGILLFREDFGGNDPNDPRISTTPVPGMTYNQLTDDRFGSMRSGSYLVTKSGYCNGDTTSSNTPQNRRSQWHIQDDHTYPDDNTRGYFMEVDGKGDNKAFYTTTIDGLCSGTDLSFIAYVANVMTWVQYKNNTWNYAYPRLLFRLTNPNDGQELAVYDTGDIPFDSTFMGDNSCWKQSSQWRQVGMNFPVPAGVEAVTLTIHNNCPSYYGNDFAIDDIEIRLCSDPIYIHSDTACRKKPHTLQAIYEDYRTIETPEFQWYYSTDSAGFYNEIDGETSLTYLIPEVHKSHEGWYRVAVAEDGHTADEHCRSVSEPFHMQTKYCDTYTEQQIDTTACDTLLAESYTWRGHIWNNVGALTDTIKDFEDDDSVYVHLTMHDKQCCPDIQTVYVDSAICDTLMPFIWFFRDTMLLFEDIGQLSFERPHAKWEKCVGNVYTLHLDTFHCERLYPLIVNKYNWQLVCDNVALRRFFPDNTALGFQWYKNGEPIPGATEDDYAEQNELNGVFQLQIRLDAPVDNHDEYIWSNILEIGEVQAPEPVVKTIYYWHRLTIIRYRQGDRIWYEKKLR